MYSVHFSYMFFLRKANLNRSPDSVACKRLCPESTKEEAEEMESDNGVDKNDDAKDDQKEEDAKTRERSKKKAEHASGKNPRSLRSSTHKQCRGAVSVDITTKENILPHLQSLCSPFLSSCPLLVVQHHLVLSMNLLTLNLKSTVLL